MNFNSYHDISLLSRFFLLISKVLIRNKLNYQESFVYYCQRYAYELADSHYGHTYDSFQHGLCESRCQHRLEL